MKKSGVPVLTWLKHFFFIKINIANRTQISFSLEDQIL